MKNWPKLLFIRGEKGLFNRWCFSWPSCCPPQYTPVPVLPPNPLRYFTSSCTNQPISKHLHPAVWLQQHRLMPSLSPLIPGLGQRTCNIFRFTVKHEGQNWVIPAPYPPGKSALSAKPLHSKHTHTVTAPHGTSVFNQQVLRVKIDNLQLNQILQYEQD